ncbi:hypothetical protein [uncultured Negativibacillus sp.]|uniref:hypothetical protein n=1 Tax=uncultured Negativibacillus sp. TaxID=1980696 RepID=UPI0025CCA206|nr:hypothetical protein [uncultured Negativibacillus sp.]
MSQRCIDCRHCWKDDRSTDYRRPPCYFCLKKGPFQSRSWQIGQGSRIDPMQDACKQFSPR